MADVKLLALDLDGTLFNNEGKITPLTIEAIRKAINKGVQVIISTGRPYCGIPFAQLKDVDIEYAITVNGGGVYRIKGVEAYQGLDMKKDLILERPIPTEKMEEILPFLLSKRIHMDAFIHGDGFSPEDRLPIAQKLNIAESLKEYIIGSRIRVPDLLAFIKENNFVIQKMTLNFLEDGKGGHIDREDVRNYLEGRGDIEVCSGGYSNLEFTNQAVTKGNALKDLAASLGIPMECTMAIGDTENDLSIMEAAAIGVAMGNAPDDIKEKADWVTASNLEDGVAMAIEHFIL